MGLDQIPSQGQRRSGPAVSALLRPHCHRELVKQINNKSALTEAAGTEVRVGRPIVKAGWTSWALHNQVGTAERRERTGLAPVMSFEILPPLLQKHSYWYFAFNLHAITIKARFLSPPW